MTNYVILVIFNENMSSSSPECCGDQRINLYSHVVDFMSEDVMIIENILILSSVQQLVNDLLST